MLKTYWKIMDSAKCPVCDRLDIRDDLPYCGAVREGRVAPPWQIMAVCPLFSPKSCLNSDEKLSRFYIVQGYLKSVADKEKEGSDE